MIVEPNPLYINAFKIGGQPPAGLSEAEEKIWLNQRLLVVLEEERKLYKVYAGVFTAKGIVGLIFAIVLLMGVMRVRNFPRIYIQGESEVV